MPAHYWWLLFAVGLACLDLACASLCPAFSLKVCQFLDSLHLQTWIFNFSLLFFLFSPSPTLPSPSSSSPTHTLSSTHTHTHAPTYTPPWYFSHPSLVPSFWSGFSLSFLQPAWILMRPQDLSHDHLPGNLLWTLHLQHVPSRVIFSVLLKCPIRTSISVIITMCYNYLCSSFPPLESRFPKCFIFLIFLELKIVFNIQKVLKQYSLTTWIML